MNTGIIDLFGGETQERQYTDFIQETLVEKQLTWHQILNNLREIFNMATQMKQGNSMPHSTTSIGKSTNTKPKNKHKRRQWKAYRGQGK